jgi:hypothetical protein
MGAGIGSSSTSPLPPELDIEKLERLSPAELRGKADECFRLLETCGQEQKPAVLGQAQFYLAEVDRREDARIARRDFFLELLVIILILGEIIFGLYEGHEQAKILERMDKSTADTAMVMKDASAALKTLTDEQKMSLEGQKQANVNLQTNLKQTATMATALREQLKIIQQEQAQRESQLSKKPKLELNIAGVTLNTTIPVNYKVREQSDTTMAFDFSLANSGNATATKGLVRVLIQAKEVGLTCSSPFQKLVEEPDSLLHTYIIPFDYLRPRGALPVTITFTFPKSQSPFPVLFNADAEEIETGTFLGQLLVKPRKPLN